MLLLGVLGFSEPTVASVIVVGALDALAGLALVQARIGVAKRRRVRKAVKRAEKRLGIKAVTG